MIIALLLTPFVMASCTQRRTSDNPVVGPSKFTVCVDAFLSFAEHFSETSSFAFANVSGHRVLLVSQETFGNNVNSDMEAMCGNGVRTCMNP